MTQPDKLTIEERVARIEKWIDFWETIETGWSVRITEREYAQLPKLPPDNLVKACIDSITKLADQKPNEILDGHVDMLELLDMSLTLVEALKAPKRESIGRWASMPQS